MAWTWGFYLEVVNISLCPHHHFVGWDRLTAGAARPTVPKQSEHKNRKPVCMAFKNMKAVVPILLILPLTWYSRSDTESCLLYCSRWCQCPPAGLGSKSIWGSECASSIPWRKAGSGQRSSPHILHMTWGLVVRLALGCSPCWPHWLLSMQQCDNWWSRWQKHNIQQLSEMKLGYTVLTYHRNGFGHRCVRLYTCIRMTIDTLTKY